MDSLEALHQEYLGIDNSINWISAEIKKTKSKKKLRELFVRLQSEQRNLDNAEKKYNVNFNEII